MFRKISLPLSLLLLAISPNLPVLASISSRPVTEAAAGVPNYDSATAAIVAAVNTHNPVSIREDREYLGAILRRDGRYTWVAAAGIPGQDRISVRLRVPKGAEVIAFWHTHGAAADERRYFSDTDTALVARWGLPFYLADHTGQLKVFHPGDRTISPLRARRLGLPRRSGFARGRSVDDYCGAPIRIATVEEDRAGVQIATAAPAAALR